MLTTNATSVNRESESPPRRPGMANSPHKHENYFWRFAQIQVKEKLFQLPIEPFVEGSEEFVTQYGLVDEENKHEQADDGRRKVVNFDDVEVAEFEAFLKALLPPIKSPFSKPNPFNVTLTLGEWESVLKLSTRWSFNSLRAIAIDHLDPPFRFDRKNYTANPTAFSESSIKFVSLARTYKVSWWLKQSYRCLVYFIVNERPLTLQEAGSVGHDTAHELQALALRRLHSQNKGVSGLDAEIEELSLFRAELAALREEEEKYGPVRHLQMTRRERSEDSDSDTTSDTDDDTEEVQTDNRGGNRSPPGPTVTSIYNRGSNRESGGFRGMFWG